MPVGVRRLSVPFTAVRTLEPRFLAALVPIMRQHVRLLAVRATAPRANVSLHHRFLSLRPGRRGMIWKRQTDHGSG